MAVITRYSNIELIELPDCSGLSENGKCSWLNVEACTGEGCPYFKRGNSMLEVWERLNSLDEKMQEHIAEKYYGGVRPWAPRNLKHGGKQNV